MAKRKSVIVGDFEFPSKDKAKAFYRAILNRYKPGARLNEEDQGFIADLLTLHPEASDKIGVGLAYITVETDEHYGTTQHFTAHRTDGEYTDFSYIACIDGRNIRNDVLGALREAVADQIIAFRERFFLQHALTATCPLTGQQITPQSYHVDHEQPLKFTTLAKGWLASENLLMEQVGITPPGDNQIVAKMTSPDQRHSWTEFHRARAQLRMLSPHGNLSHGNKRAQSGG